MAAEKIISIEDRLQMLRARYKNPLELRMGDLIVPVRFVTVKENLAIMNQAKIDVIKVPGLANPELEISTRVMKAMLATAAGVILPPQLLDSLLPEELSNLYGQYMELARQGSPEFETWSETEVIQMVEAVKKKEADSTTFSIKLLAAIGAYYLETIPPTANEPG